MAEVENRTIARSVLTCVYCMINDENTKLRPAVTIMGGDALCVQHATKAIARRRGADRSLGAIVTRQRGPEPGQSGGHVQG